MAEAYPNSLLVIHHQKPKNEKPKIKNGFVIVQRVKEIEGVSGVSAQLATQVFYTYGELQVAGNLAGVNIIDEDKLFNLKDKVVEGNLEGLMTGNNGILMGTGLAKKLNIKVNTEQNDQII